MGEESVHLKDNGNADEQQESNTSSDDNIQEEEIEFDDISPEEFAKLDSQLDALNSALDDIEQKNDDIHAKLLELLHSNREIRKQLNPNSSASTDENKPN